MQFELQITLKINKYEYCVFLKCSDKPIILNLHLNFGSLAFRNGYQASI